MKILCIYGCGGMGREIADLTSSMDKWEKIIFIDDNIKKRLVDGFPVLTLVETLNQFNKSDLDFIVATGEPSSREFIHKRIENYDLNIVNVTYPGFNLSRLSSIDIGTIVHSGTIITVNVHVGKGCLINKHVVIGHDVIIGDFTVISPNVTIGGNTNIESNCFLGSGSIIKNGINIGKDSIIGMGAVVLEDVEANSVMAGNPAKLIRTNIDKRVFKK